MSLKEAKENFILDTASKLFLKDSIEGITIKDIALSAGVGEATIYRMFGKKEKIVTLVAIRIQNEVFDKYFNLPEGLNGYQMIKEFYSIFLKIYKDNVDYFKFINEFDNFIIKSDYDELTDYEANMTLYLDQFRQAYFKGLDDNSVRPIENLELFYLTTTHSLLNLCKKLAAGSILSQDEKYNNLNEITTLINIIMFNLKH